MKILALGWLLAVSGAEPPPRLNVLMIMVDDLRPQLGCYGASEMKTPNIDRFASTARVFTKHYVQAPTCGASRYSLLTGRYPREPQALSNAAFRLAPASEPADPYCIPHLFRRNGYRTASLGKVTHNPGGREDPAPNKKGSAAGFELPFAFDEWWSPVGQWKTEGKAYFGYSDGRTRTPGQSPPTESADVADDGYPDGLLAEAAVSRLRTLKGQPFFLAVGFFKPHLPFNAPKKYWDLYDPDSTPSTSTPPPTGVEPTISLSRSGELLGNYGGHDEKGRIVETEARRLRHGYRAAVSYVDAQIGRVLDELKRLDLDGNTAVVLWGDHGWHLGESGVWGKHTLTELSLRSPLLVRIPGMISPGKTSDAVVESIDLFPTLAEVCGMKGPANLDGRSFTPALMNASLPSDDVARAFWQNGPHFGQTIRTAAYRLTTWTDRAGKVVQTELYDHTRDPAESSNASAKHPQVVADLSKKLIKERLPRNPLGERRGVNQP